MKTEKRKFTKNDKNRIKENLKENRLIGQVSREFVNGLGDLGSIPGWVIPKTLKMVLDTTLLNTKQ